MVWPNMQTGTIITVITRGDEPHQSAPDGFRYVEQMFTEAGLHSQLGDDASHQFWGRLRAIQRGLNREFKGRIRWRFMSQWTLLGLWVSVRCRVRETPCLIIAGQHYGIDTPLDRLEDAVRKALDR